MATIFRAGLRALALAGVLSAPAAAQDTTLRLAHVAPSQGSYQEAAERFSGALDTLSGGTMAVDIVPGGALGDLGQLWVQTRTGALDLHLIDLGALVAMREARSFLILWTPFLFDDQGHFRRYAASETLARMMGEVESATGLVYLGLVGDRPPRALTTAGTPVQTPEDLAGLRIRTPENPMVVEAFEAWGATPAPIPASDLFTALRTGLVDGQDNGILDTLEAGYLEAQNHYMPLDYIHSGIGLWMSSVAWASASPDQQDWLRAAAQQTGEEGAALHDAAMANAMDTLPFLGIEITTPDIDSFLFVRDSMIDAMEGDVWPEGLAAEIGGL